MPQTKRAKIVVETIGMGLLAAFFAAFLVAYPVMLMLGALHSQWAVVPAFGYWTTFLVTWVLLCLRR